MVHRLQVSIDQLFINISCGIFLLLLRNCQVCEMSDFMGVMIMPGHVYMQCDRSSHSGLTKWIFILIQDFGIRPIMPEFLM
jgi:hypothetical protein